MIAASHKHQMSRHDRTWGTSKVGGCDGRVEALAADEAQDWSALRGRAGFHVTCTTPLQSPGFLPCRAQLGRAFGLGSLSRRDVRSRLQFSRIGYQPGSYVSDPLERHVCHSKSVGFNTTELMRGKTQNAGIPFQG